MVYSRTLPLPYTLLSLARYAKILGITPPHFFMAHAPNSVPSPVWPVSTCGGVWPRHSWQNYDQISLEDLAMAIQDAERELAKATNYWPAPMWISEEQHPFPRDFYRTSLYQIYDVRGFNKGLNTSYGRVVECGTRAVTLLGTPTTAGGGIVYTDNDADGFYETATVTLAGITATTDVCKVKLYVAGMGGAMEWEIRPERTKTLVAGALTARFDSWLFINPDLQAEYPTDEGFSAVDISTTANFVTSVDVYYEYTDTTDTSAQFLWEPITVGGFCNCCSGTGCSACTLTTQNGCSHIRDAKTGILVPTPSSYDAVNGWTASGYDVCRAPDQVKFWYYAGDRSDEFLSGRSCDPLSDFWARLIATLATARLVRPPCGCPGVKARFEFLQEDLTLSEGSKSYFSGPDVLGSPFGTRRGEVMAWRRIKHAMPKRLAGVSV